MLLFHLLHKTVRYSNNFGVIVSCKSVTVLFWIWSFCLTGSSLQRLITVTVELYGHIDCLVNNAGWRESLPPVDIITTST